MKRYFQKKTALGQFLPRLSIFFDLAVTTKAVAGAKSLGNFLYSAVNKAGAKVSEAGAKIKKTVEENVSNRFKAFCFRFTVFKKN